MNSLNYLHHKHQTPGRVISVPDELKELLFDLSKEVLREQPKDIYTFIADYLDDRLYERENRIVASKTVESVLDYSWNITALLNETEIDPKKAESAVRLIREAFSKHFEIGKPNVDKKFEEKKLLRRLVKECGFTVDEAKSASAVIQSAYNSYFYRHVRPDLLPKGDNKETDWKDAAEVTLNLYARSGASKGEIDRAALNIMESYKKHYSKEDTSDLEQKAIIIQAAYRGYKTRKSLQSEIHEEEIDLDKKATVIQAAFKGYLVRKSTKTIIESPQTCLSNTSQELKRKFKRIVSEWKEGKEEEIAAKNENISKLVNFYTEIRKLEDEIEIDKQEPNIEERERKIMDHENEIKRCMSEVKKAEHALNDYYATVIKAHWKGKHYRKKFWKDINDEKEKAATKIQAAFRGYSTRKKYKAFMKLTKLSSVEYSESKEFMQNEMDFTENQIEKAAINIQAHVRGYLTRKKLGMTTHSED